jgi:[ribosomal protein S5]-alanine N-acetyltransferase
MLLDCGICRIRPWTLADAPSISPLANNRQIADQLRDRFPYPYGREDAENFLARATAERPQTNFAIDTAGKLAGGIGLILGSDIERVSAELGYWIGEPFWGRGIATAAVRGLTDWAFSEFKLTRIFAIPFVDNAVSIRVLEKCGFEREALLRCSAIKNGVIRDQYLYSLVL